MRMFCCLTPTANRKKAVDPPDPVNKGSDIPKTVDPPDPTVNKGSDIPKAVDPPVPVNNGSDKPKDVDNGSVRAVGIDPTKKRYGRSIVLTIFRYDVMIYHCIYIMYT